jgi:hypothetical protein
MSVFVIWEQLELEILFLVLKNRELYPGQILPSGRNP